jgi:hypothetical protein
MYEPSDLLNSYVLLRSFESKIIWQLVKSTESDSDSDTAQLHLKSQLATTSFKLEKYSRFNFLEAMA